MSTDDLSEEIRDLDLPAHGDQLQEARDSVRVAYEFLCERGSATSQEIKKEVYPEFETSHVFAEETADSWWKKYAEPGLEQLSTVERAGEEWRVRA